MTMPSELAALPQPSIIEEVGFEARLAVLRARLADIFAAAGIAYDVDNLETDPAQILLQVSAYKDALLRQRINEAVRAYLLPFASGSDLDVLAGFYDVVRIAGEPDARLRDRIVLAIKGRSTGGTEPRYKAIAMAADLRVADVSIYTVGRDPTIRVSVFATDNGGMADEALIAVVDAALQNPSVRMVNDRIVVAPAAKQTISVAAEVWLLPETSTGVTVAMEAALRAAWRAEIVLGRDVTKAWLVAKLMLTGVQRVEITTPATDIVLPHDAAAALGTVVLSIRGRDF